MSFSFECRTCQSVTIFKEIENVPRSEISCANCSKHFNVKIDLVKFDRKDKGMAGLLAADDGTLETRIRKLVQQFEDLEDRLERLEYLVMQTRDEVQLND